MPEKKNMTTTAKARIKIAEARGTGGAIAKITHIAVGEGGLNNDRTQKTFDRNQDTLYKEIKRFGAVQLERKDNKNSYKIIVEQSDSSIDGKEISEIGLIDADGDLVAAQTFLPKIKDANTEFVFTLTEEI